MHTKPKTYSPEIKNFHKKEILGLLLQYTSKGPLPLERICEFISYEYYGKTVENLVGVSLPILVKEWSHPFFVVDERNGILGLDKGVLQSVVKKMVSEYIKKKNKISVRTGEISTFLQEYWDTCIWSTVFGLRLISFLKTSGFKVIGDNVKANDEDILLALIVAQLNPTCSLKNLETYIQRSMSGRRCQDIVGKTLIAYLNSFPVFIINEDNKVGMIPTSTLLSSIIEYVKQQDVIVTIKLIENFVLQEWTLPVEIITGKPVRSFLSQAQGLFLQGDRVVIEKPKRKPIRNWYYNQNQVFRGNKPPSPFMNYVHKLPPYYVPNQIKSVFETEEMDVFTFHNFLKLVYQQLVGDIEFTDNISLRDCKKFLHHMLYFEEMQMLLDMRHYDLYGIRLIPADQERYRINVPSLAENRPSVLRGDHVILRPCSIPSQRHEGYIYFVNLDNIVVDFSKEMKNLKSGIFDLRFEITRTPLRKMHYGVDYMPEWFLPRTRPFRNCNGNLGTFEKLPLQLTLDIIQDVNNLSSLALCSRGLFTLTFANFIEKKKKYPFTLINTVQLNRCQKQAVSMIISQPKIPVVIHGPPGTGKTVTLIEAILQLQTRGQPILVCTPTNHSADQICTLLLKAPPPHPRRKKFLFRLNGFQRNPKTLPNELWKCSYYEGGSFCIPNVEVLKEFDVIVCTFVSSGYMVGLGLWDHFRAFCVDEAAQVLETELVIPLPLLQQNATVALFGDHKQLGPIIRSPLCKDKKFDISTMERFIEYNILKIRLIESYRAHPEIMNTYSNLFYDRCLINRCSNEISNLFVGENLLKNKDIPNLFIHVAGIEQQDKDSPSWYNQAEIEEVVKQIVIIQKIKKVKNEDIGIITPYQKQSDKFKGRFHNQKPAFDGIKVGTTEQFQGEERKVILISVVRSTSNYLVNDSKYRLGFVSIPKRMNVAISRARSLLIIIGNAELLYASDANWKQLIQRYIDLNLYIGPLNFINQLNMGEKEEICNDLNYDSEWKLNE